MWNNSLSRYNYSSIRNGIHLIASIISKYK
ncbi:hypothetical protein EMIT0324P_120015 [Pseudomonas chlororaphis]